MSYQEKKNFVALLGTLIFALIYFTYLYSMYISGELITLDEYQFWAKSVLIVISVKIALSILLNILFNIINSMISKDHQPKFRDEFDDKIELNALKNSFVALMLGFMAAMISATLGYEIYVMFNLLILAYLSAEMTGTSAQLYYYRKGL